MVLDSGGMTDESDGQRSDAKRVLWVSAHPEPRSLNGSLRDAGVRALTHAGHTVVESDLYRDRWNPVLDRRGLAADRERFDVTQHQREAFLEGRQPAHVRREQRKVRDADALVLQFPLWWYGMPAILKGWFDRVFVSGFAFGKDAATGRRLRFEQGPFVGKRAFVLLTLGDRPAAIGPRGISGELHELLFGLLHGTLAYTGMSVLPPMAVPSADFTDAAGFAGHVEHLASRLDGLFTDEPLPYRPQFQGDYTDAWELVDHVRPGESGLSLHWTDEHSAAGCHRSRA